MSKQAVVASITPINARGLYRDVSASILVKLGGGALLSPSFPYLLQEMHRYCAAENIQYYVVHGGGWQLSSYCKKEGITPRFDIEGNRITGEQEIQAAARILGGELRMNIICLCRKLGIPAVTVSAADGATAWGQELACKYSAESSNKPVKTHTGQVLSCNSHFIKLLTGNGYVPFIHSLTCNKEGVALNINADDLALSLAIDLQVSGMYFIGDTPGVLLNQKTVSRLNRTELTALIQSKKVQAGMRKKVSVSLAALTAGIEVIGIGNYTRSGDFQALMHAQRGTRIYA